MIRKQSTIFGRSLLVWLTASVVVAALLALALPVIPPAAHTFDQHLVRLAAVVLSGCVSWLWLITTAVIVDGLRTRPAGRLAGVPVRWQQAVSLTCGLALASAATLASATAAHSTAASSAISAEDPDGPRISGLPMPERPEGGLRPRSPAPAPTPAPAPAPDRTHLVDPGQSLWSIAYDDLDQIGVEPATTAVAEHLERLYQRNRAVIGPQPDLIYPGQRLLLPPRADQPAPRS